MMYAHSLAVGTILPLYCHHISATFQRYFHYVSITSSVTSRLTPCGTCSADVWIRPNDLMTNNRINNFAFLLWVLSYWAGASAITNPTTTPPIWTPSARWGESYTNRPALLCHISVTHCALGRRKCYMNGTFAYDGSMRAVLYTLGVVLAA
jgi:hypothetical protein